MAGVVILILSAVAMGLIQWRVGLWRMSRMLDEKSRPLDDPELNGLIARLGACVDLPELRALVLDMPVVNGLATPDGRIVITTALYDKYRFGIIKAEEVASIRDGIVRLATDGVLRATLRMAGLQHAAGFTWQHSARQLLDAYARFLP